MEYALNILKERLKDDEADLNNSLMRRHKYLNIYLKTIYGTRREEILRQIQQIRELRRSIQYLNK